MLRDGAAAIVRMLAGVCARYRDPAAFEGVRVFFANHTSHLDFPVIWSALPPEQRTRCVPVAAKEYWRKGPLRRWLSSHVFQALLIDRTRVTAENNPIRKMAEILASGKSLILFPEGTRSRDGAMQPFKSGLYHLAKADPQLRFVPVCLENLNRILPKGEYLPIPLMSSVVFGEPLTLSPDESKSAFLERASDAIKELRRHAD